MMARLQLIVLGLALFSAFASAQDTNVTTSAVSPTQVEPAVVPSSDLVVQNATAPAPESPAAAEAEVTLAPPPPPIYAPKRSFGQWVRDLKHDPTLLIAFIVSLLSGVGFLFIIYALGAELVQGIPYTFGRKGRSQTGQRTPSPPSSMDEKMRTAY